MDSIASTKAEADAELKKLRAERGIGEEGLSDSVLVSSLDEALHILSDQLYQTPTRFLLELIQNADDNSYARGVVPSLCLSLRKRNGQRWFRTDCNEVGFTYKQLDALARVGRSTKTATTNGQKGYIGEKGIGFKSVFKVADVVHIASGFYEFKFDRNEPIGMMLPILSRFPSRDRVANHTQFLLELKYNDGYQDIRQELEAIEPQLLIFLRTLEQIRISTRNASKFFHRHVTEYDEDFNGETITVLEVTDHEGLKQCKRYIVERYSVPKLPLEPRREGVTTSEVVVAFAVKNEFTPIATAQKVFAFLPIDDFGFQFLIHADFLLVASRESLEYRSPWNLALRDGIRKAFVQAIDRISQLSENEDGKGLCYTWPRYLSRQSGSGSFWDILYQDILNTLRDEDILKSRDAMDLFQKPKTLHYVPENYRFENETLFDLPSINRSHLSFDYDEVRQMVSLIGVCTLTIENLCDEFDAWVEEVGEGGIKEQSVKWHRKISSLFCGRTRLKQRLREFPIIPLRDGSWVTAKQKHVYVASKNKDEHVPAGIKLSIVDQDASQDPVRREFFKFLGIEEYSPRQVCDLILELHQDMAADKIPRSNINLIADSAYLFKHRSHSREYGAPNIFFLAMKDGKTVLKRSEQIYLIDPKIQPNLIAKYRNTTGNPFQVLIDEYEITVCKDGTEETAKEFRTWLRQSKYLPFTTAPTLVRDAQLSREWKFLRDQDVIDLLYAVKIHWQNNNLPQRLLEAVAALKVRCLDGVTRALGRLAVPTTELEQKCPHLDFVKLPNPTLGNWGFLSEFGVITICDTSARLRELQALGELPAKCVDKDAVHDIYQVLNSNMSLNKKKIQTTFRKSPLVFIAKPKPKWLSHEACVWTAPSSLKKVVKLKSSYGDCKKMFCDLLDVKAASTRHVVDEFCSISDTDDQVVQRFEELLCLLDDFHSNKSSLSGKQIERIQQASVFPILKKRNGCEEEPEIVLLSVEDTEWYIPDKTTLESAFKGKVDILSLPGHLVRKLKDLFVDLGCEDKFLSSAVEETVEPGGTSIRDKPREDDLKTRLKYISQLAPRDSEFPNYNCVQVWSVPSITSTRSLGDVEVIRDNALITIKENEGTTVIYIREGVQWSDQSKVNYELVEHFIPKLGIDNKHANLVNRLMSAPKSDLPEVIEEHDMDILEDSTNEQIDGGGDDCTASDVESVNASCLTPTSSQPSQSFRDSIPPHQSRAESISQRANHFRIPNLLVARTPFQHYKSASEPCQSLSIRTRGISSGGGPSPGQSTSNAIPHGSFSNENTSELSRIYSRVYQTLISSPSRPPPRTVYEFVAAAGIRSREIGFLGELLVYELFKYGIDDWTFENWTSRLRVEAGYPRFTGREKDFSDFTYVDRSGHMRRRLRKIGVVPKTKWSNTTTFHLEVKSTLEGCATAFFVSQNQLDKMRDFDGDPENAYVLLRLFGIEESDGPSIKFFRDPWSLYMNKTLDFKAEQGYKVYGGEEIEEFNLLS